MIITGLVAAAASVGLGVLLASRPRRPLLREQDTDSIIENHSRLVKLLLDDLDRLKQTSRDEKSGEEWYRTLNRVLDGFDRMVQVTFRKHSYAYRSAVGPLLRSMRLAVSLSREGGVDLDLVKSFRKTIERVGDYCVEALVRNEFSCRSEFIVRAVEAMDAETVKYESQNSREIRRRRQKHY